MPPISDLDIQAKPVFCQLLHLLQTSRQALLDGHLEIALQGDATLIMEKIPGIAEVLWGTGERYRLTYRYTNNRTKVIRNPEMIFLVVDYRSDPDEYSLIGIYACTYVSDHFKSDQSSLSFDNSRLTGYTPHLHALHTSFANVWMQDILAKGYLGAAPTSLDPRGTADQS